MGTVRRTLLPGCMLVLVLASAGSAAELAERTKAKIAAVEAALPQGERAADACEKALQPLLDSGDPNVILAVDGARLRISAVRSIRIIIEKEPGYFAWHLSADVLARWQEAMDYFLDCARSVKDPFAGKTSGVRTLRSPIDGQILFYVFRLPRDFDATRTYPLDVELHSGAALTWRAGWIDGNPSDDPGKANAEPRITISPCGRGNNSYSGLGEVAVADAVRDALRNYPVDENRVTVGGASMGGTGAFRMIAFHPELFAAGYSLTGGAYYGSPKGNGRFDATLLVDNFFGTGFLIYDAPREGHFKDNRAFADMLRERTRKHPGSCPNLELTDPEGGHGVIDLKLIAGGKTWLRKQVRNPQPARVVYTTYCLRYDGAYWARIDTVTDPTAPARIEAEFHPPNRIDVVTGNVERFHLLPVFAQVHEVRVNGSPAIRWPPGPDRYFTRLDGNWTLSRDRYPQGLVKKHGLSGPVQDVFMEHPVLMVYGTLRTKDPAASTAMIDESVLGMFGPGDGSAILHTPFERKADGDVTADDIARKNLVLYGTPGENSLLARVAAKLPVRFLDDGVEIDGKSYRGGNVGLVMAYPNPLNPERYVLVLPEHHGRFDPRTLPDYVAAKTEPGYGGPVIRHLAEGHFDSHWRLGEAR